ncbi:MAG: PLP-dependent aminotransferase family protein [Pseudomonadota bacterium]
MPKPYVQIADRLADRILQGALPVGTRLPPQRTFAYETGIAVSTASRVYEELRRRGLVSGEVGRGTFVCNRFAPLDPSLQEPSGMGIDLDIVFRVGPEARERIAHSTGQFFKRGLGEQAVAPPSATVGRSAAEAFAGLMRSDGFALDPAHLLAAGNGKQAIAAAFSALAPRGGRIAVEAMTYPFAIAVARMLGITLVPLPMDDAGLEPDALDRAADAGLDGVYLQPTLQSPLVLTMPEERRRAIARLLQRHDLIAVEDRVYGFLKPTVPLAAWAPSHVILIDSLSKRLMPGMALGLIGAPPPFRAALARALRTGGWMAPSLSVALAEHWTRDGVVAAVEASKRREAEAMYAIAREAFAGLSYRGAGDALHSWLDLPKAWRAESFVAACAALGIAVATGSAFAVGTGFCPPGVRIASSATDLQTWRYALGEVSKLARQAPLAG